MTEQNDYLPLTTVNWIEDYPEVIKWLREDHKKVTGILPHRATVVWNLNHMAKHNPGESSISGLVDRVANRYRKARSISKPMEPVAPIVPYPAATLPTIPDNVSVETLIEALAEVAGCTFEDLTSSYQSEKPSPFDYVDIAPGKPDEIGKTFWVDMLISRARTKLSDHEVFFPEDSDAPGPEEDPEKDDPRKPEAPEEEAYSALLLREGDSIRMTRTIWRVTPTENHRNTDPEYRITFAEEDMTDLLTERGGVAGAILQSLIQLDHKLKGQRAEIVLKAGGVVSSCTFK